MRREVGSEDLIVERLHEELDCAFSHGLYPHSRIPMCGDKDDRNPISISLKPSLQVQTRHSRHTHVCYQTRHFTLQAGLKDLPLTRKVLAENPSASTKSCSALWTDLSSSTIAIKVVP